MSKVIFINRFFFPDLSATSQMLSDVVFNLVEYHDDVCVIASRMKYDDPSASLPAHETINNVNVYRVETSRFGRDTYRGRAVDSVFFYFSASFKLFKIIKKDDIVVVKTDPPLLSVIIAVIVKLRRAVLVNWLQDLFPEVAVELNVRFMKGVIEQLLITLRNWSLGVAKFNVVIGSVMAERLADLGVMRQKIRIIHNWADGSVIYPLLAEENPLRQAWGLQDKFIVGYSGNFGRAHEFDTLIRAMEVLQAHERIVFLFIGGGTQLNSLKEACQKKSLSNVVFKPYQPRDLLKYSLTVSNIHMVILQPDLEGLIVPSKFYGIAASGRPTLFIGSYNGEISVIIRQANAGYTIKTGDYNQLVGKIQLLEQNEPLCNSLGKSARKLFEQSFDSTISIKAWRELLMSCGLT